MVARALTIVSLAAALLAAASPAHARRGVPQGFVGMNVDGPALAPPLSLDSELRGMVSSGVESIRTAFYWAAAQPYPSFDAVPPDQRSRYTDVAGVPTDFSAADRIVGAAAVRRITVLPTVLSTPAWAAVHPGSLASPPAGTGPYTRFLAALIGRYGPHGNFWSENPSLPRVPIREWQIWNEPDSTKYWSDQPFPNGYVRLLRAAYRTVHRLDHGARVVLSGFPGRSWALLERIYRAGGRRWFDVAAVHPFTRLVKNVMRILRYDRAVMARFHDARKPLIATEASWPSAKGKTTIKYGFEVTRSGEASRIRVALPLLAQKRRLFHLAAVYWYTWLSYDKSRIAPFDYAGLLTLTSSGDVVPKPAWRAFRTTALRIEGCRRKVGVATSCRRS